MRGPGVVNMDFSLFRTFKLTERFNLQFRAEAFNLSNTPHFSNPNGNANSIELRQGYLHGECLGVRPVSGVPLWVTLGLLVSFDLSSGRSPSPDGLRPIFFRREECFSIVAGPQESVAPDAASPVTQPGTNHR